MIKIQHLLQEKREDILAVAAKHGAFNVRVRGEVSRGEETETSDIDLIFLRRTRGTKPVEIE
jgi:uncharacterized protein